MAAIHTRQPSLVDMHGWLETHYRSHTARLEVSSWLSWLHRSHLGKDGWGTAISAISAICYGCVIEMAAILQTPEHGWW